MQAPDTKPGLYYVSVRRGKDYRFLVGPFINDHAAALALVDKVRRYAVDIDPRGAWYEYGTARIDICNDWKFGTLNDKLQDM